MKSVHDVTASIVTVNRAAIQPSIQVRMRLGEREFKGGRVLLDISAFTAYSVMRL